MARQVGVSAVTVIVSLLIGGKLLGILGAILAVPTAAILQVLFTELTATTSEVTGSEPRSVGLDLICMPATTIGIRRAEAHGFS